RQTDRLQPRGFAQTGDGPSSTTRISLRRAARSCARSSPSPTWIRVVRLIVVGWFRTSQRAAGLLHQIRLDEVVEIAVEHPVHVSDFGLRWMVLDHLVRLQDVAANLTAECDVALLASELLELRLLLFHLQIEET